MNYDPDDRQLRLLHLESGAILGRARSRGQGFPQRRNQGGGHRGAETRGHCRFARTVHSQGGGNFARRYPRVRGQDPHSRGLSRPSGDRPGLRRGDRACGKDRARQDLDDPSHRPRGVSRAAEPLRRDALSFARDSSRDFAGLSGSHRRVRRRRNHGRAPSQPRRRGRAVPPRVLPHRARPRPVEKLSAKGGRMSITAQEALTRTIEHREIFHDEMLDLMRQIMGGQMSPVIIAAIIVGLRVKKETIGEITAAAQVMRELATKVAVKDPDNLVDIVGTGGDGAHTFNISTASMFVCAAAGGRVAKHGNRAVSSQSGSADVLEALGANINLKPEQVGRCIDEAGVGFMFAPAHHSAMKHAAPVRRELGVRTIFNILGPLTNPAGAPTQVMGVFHPDLVGIQVRVLEKLGARHAMIVYGMEGLDEISVSGETMVGELKDREVHEYTVHPEKFGLRIHDPGALRVATVEESRKLVLAALENEAGAARDIVGLNAGAAIYVAGKAGSFEDGVGKAFETIKSGAARAKLDQFVKLTQQLARG